MRAIYIACLTALFLLSPSTKAEQGSHVLIKAKNANQVHEKIDPSFAQIIIKSSDLRKAENANRKGSEFISLPEIARQTMQRHFFAAPESKQKSISAFADSFKVAPQFHQTAGVFVTLSTDGKTRACWGSVYPREANIAREVVLATMGALSKEYRFKAINKFELKKLKVQVTVVKGLEAVSSVKSINPFKDGVMVRSGGRGGVILPGEAVDAHYEFVLARLKAGIKPEEPCQIYKIRAEIYD